MIYFKSLSGEVFAYESKKDRDLFGDRSLVPMTPDEVNSHLNPLPPMLSRSDIESLRRRAYADPLIGSDCLFSESLRMQSMGEAGHEEVRARAVARFEEIQAQYPWPSK